MNGLELMSTEITVPDGAGIIVLHPKKSSEASLSPEAILHRFPSHGLVLPAAAGAA